MRTAVENLVRDLWLPGLAAVIVMVLAVSGVFAQAQLPQRLVEVNTWQGGNMTIAISQDDKLVVTSGKGGTWIHTSEGEQLHHFKTEEMGGIHGFNHVQFSPNGKLVFLYNRDGNVWVCPVGGDKCDIALPGNPATGVLAINEACQDVNTPPKDLPKSPVIEQLGYALSKKNRNGKTEIHLYNPQGKEMSVVDMKTRITCTDIDIIERAGEAYVYATFGKEGATAQTYVVSYSKLAGRAGRWVARALPRTLGFGASVACEPGRKYVAAGGRHGVIHVWECGSHKLVSKIKAGNGIALVEGVAYSPDSKHLASVSGLFLQVWDAVTGELVAERMVRPGDFNDVVWDPSQYIYTVESPGHVKKWRLEPNEKDDPPEKTPLEPPPVSTPKPTPTPSDPPKSSLGLIYDPAVDDPANMEDATLILEPEPAPTIEPDPATTDSDADGLTDEDELTYGTDPHSESTCPSTGRGLIFFRRARGSRAK